ncbi:SIMPL domain-containing protein [Candidatus Pacearchaeota archaeon]|nr:SIMPL domain-containing protein [Candidatus Pacearchaeota archaeon]
MNNKILIGVVVIAILLVAGYLVFNAGPVVSAQGTSKISVQPDLVSVNIDVTTKNITATDAQEANKRISDALLFELVKLGFTTRELQFVNYNVYEDVDWRTNTKKGYVVSQQLVVKTDKTAKVPGIVDAAINAGALVSYINFELSEEKQREYKAQALEAASRDAKDKVQAIASGQGKRVGRLVSLINQEFYYPGLMYAYQKAGEVAMDVANSEARTAALNLNPQNLDVTASIAAQYKLSFF